MLKKHKNTIASPTPGTAYPECDIIVLYNARTVHVQVTKGWLISNSQKNRVKQFKKL